MRITTLSRWEAVRCPEPGRGALPRHFFAAVMQPSTGWTCSMPTGFWNVLVTSDGVSKNSCFNDSTVQLYKTMSLQAQVASNVSSIIRDRQYLHRTDHTEQQHSDGVLICIFTSVFCSLSTNKSNIKTVQ